MISLYAYFCSKRKFLLNNEVGDETIDLLISCLTRFANYFSLYESEKSILSVKTFLEVILQQGNHINQYAWFHFCKLVSIFDRLGLIDFSFEQSMGSSNNSLNKLYDNNTSNHMIITESYCANKVEPSSRSGSLFGSLALKAGGYYFNDIFSKKAYLRHNSTDQLRY